MRTQEQVVYGYIRRHGPVRTDDIMAAKEMARRTVNAITRRLKRKGCITTLGRTNQTRYVATEIRPDDLRGSAPGSVAALIMLAKRRKRSDKHRHRPTIYYGTALDQHWPSPVAKTIYR